VFVTGGAGTICSMQTQSAGPPWCKRLALLPQCREIEAAARDIALVRPGAKVIGIEHVMFAR